MTEWVIYKKSRAPGPVSYSGATWDRAGKRHLATPTLKPTPLNMERFWAAILCEPTNPVDED